MSNNYLKRKQSALADDISALARRVLSDEQAGIVDDMLDSLDRYHGGERAPIIAALRDKWELRRMP